MWWRRSAPPLLPTAWRQLHRSYSRVTSGPITLASLPALVEGVLVRDKWAVSRSITLLESRLPADRDLANELFVRLAAASSDASSKRPSSLRLGFTGAPGVGKSTLIERFGLFLVQEQARSLAVLISRADRVVMAPAEMFRGLDGGSVVGQGDPGGVIGPTLDAVRLCEYAGFDLILVETVGVGQSELALADLVDIFVLLVAPGIGDELQGLKKGITEVANLILVNKADDPHDRAANQTLFEYKSAVKFSLCEHVAKVLPVSGRTGRGIPEAWKAIQDLFAAHQPSETIATIRQQQAAHWAVAMAQQELVQQFQTYLASRPAADTVAATETVRSSAQRLVRAWQNSFTK